MPSVLAGMVSSSYCAHFYSPSLSYAKSFLTNYFCCSAMYYFTRKNKAYAANSTLGTSTCTNTSSHTGNIPWAIPLRARFSLLSQHHPWIHRFQAGVSTDLKAPSHMYFLTPTCSRRFIKQYYFQLGEELLLFQTFEEFVPDLLAATALWDQFYTHALLCEDALYEFLPVI